MTAQSKRHHEVPKWLLKHFCWDHGEMLWQGFKDTREVTPVNINDAFVRKYANTRIDYQSRGDGTFQQVKSDQDETILADFDDQASRAARNLIDSARQWRDTGPAVPRLSPADVETCKQTIVAQARRTRESQDRAGLSEDKSELYISLYSELAEANGQQLPSKEDLLRDSRVTGLFAAISQNHRANFASGNHSILADKEKEFLDSAGLHVAVIDPTTAEFVIGSHGITIVESTQGQTAWLPLAPDVAISLSDKPKQMGIGICADAFVESHNGAALSLSTRIAGRSKETIQKLLTTLN